MVLPGKGGFSMLQAKLKLMLKNRSVLCYGNRQETNELRSGIFEIATREKLPITPLWCSHIQDVLGIVYDQPLYIRVGSTFIPSSASDGMHRVFEFQQSMAVQYEGSLMI
jgi:hypothetical protein